MHVSTQFARTDKAIQTAMVHLLKSKPFEKITVQDILDETPVSRATFYKHYRDKYEIVEKNAGGVSVCAGTAGHSHDRRGDLG